MNSYEGWGSGSRIEGFPRAREVESSTASKIRVGKEDLEFRVQDLEFRV